MAHPPGVPRSGSLTPNIYYPLPLLLEGLEGVEVGVEVRFFWRVYTAACGSLLICLTSKNQVFNSAGEGAH